MSTEMSELEAAVLTLFDELIDRIKGRSPARSDEKPLGTMVFSQLPLGMPIWRDDYHRPWTPGGGESLQEKVEKERDEGQDPETQIQNNDRYLRAMQAAWKTSLLCRTMLKVTTDGSYLEYPTGRHLNSAYEAVMRAMQPGPQPEMAEDVKVRVDEAEKVLFETDEDGNLTKTRLYRNYLRNAMALAEAKANFAVANASAVSDPVLANAWPVASATYRRAVDEARETLITEGAAKVERALDTLASVGLPVQAGLIAKARATFDNWNLGLTGVVPSAMPYSMILPTNWCDSDDPQGFTKLTIESRQYKSRRSSRKQSASQSSWNKQTKKSSGGGGVSLFGLVNFVGKGSTSSATSSWQNSSDLQISSNFKNTAKNVKIQLEYGLCTIVRPWLISDLFFLKNWYVVGSKKNSVSDGTIDGQADSQDKLLPMIPQQILVIRNVRIQATDWGQDGNYLSKAYGGSQGSSHSSSSGGSGAGGIALGFVNLGGGGGHSLSQQGGQTSSWESRDSSSDFGTTFRNGVLEIKGAQIIAFLSDIVPACPDLDDPGLA